jgi:hypothetical protein
MAIKKRTLRKFPGLEDDKDDDDAFRITVLDRPTGSGTVIDRDLIIVGDPAGHHIRILSGQEGGIEIREGEILRGHWRIGGDILIGRDLAEPETSFLIVFSQAQLYNGENMLAGDVLLGDNSEGAANLLWRQDDGRIYVRGGQVVQATIDTDGSITAGAGNLRLNQYGIAVNANPLGNPEDESAYRFTNNQGNTVSALYGYHSSGNNGWYGLIDAQTGRNSFYEMLVQAPTGKQAIYELTLQSGTIATSIEMLADDQDINYISLLSQRINFSAEAVTFPNRTTAQRNAIVGPQKGMTLFNITVNKLQTYTGAAWVDLH